METTILTPHEEESGLRLDLLLARRYPQISRRSWKAALDAGRVKVNGRAASPGLAISPGMRIELALDVLAPGKPGLGPDPELARILTVGPPVLVRLMHRGAQISPDGFLDGLMTVNKPGGLPCHPNGSDSGGTLANALVALEPGFATAGPKPLEGGLLNRLDTGTSGLVLAASTTQAWTRWQHYLDQDEETSHHKEYLVIVEGNINRFPEARSGSWQSDWPIAHHGHKQDRAVALGSPQAQEHRGQPRAARTWWKVLDATNEASLLLARVVKAQFHQIRVHAAAMGHPLLGDSVYHLPRALRGERGEVFPGPGPRHGLHAWKMALETENGTLELCAPVPSDFVAAVEACGLRISW